MGKAVPGDPTIDEQYLEFSKMIEEARENKNLRNLDLQTLKVLAREAKFLAAEADFYSIVRYQQSTSLPKNKKGAHVRRHRKTSSK